MKPDDSSLQSFELAAVERQALNLLNRASALDVFPTPVEDILAAAQLRVAPKGMFDTAAFLTFVKKKTAQAAQSLKSALSKVFGLYDANEQIIHIDDSVGPSKQTFLKLHEVGHHELPTHRKIFSLFQDCERTLAPTVADQFEREANNFARFALFQGDRYKHMAADMAMGIKTPMALAKKFGASQYASSQEPTTARASCSSSNPSNSCQAGRPTPMCVVLRPHHPSLISSEYQPSNGSMFPTH